MGIGKETVDGGVPSVKSCAFCIELSRQKLAVVCKCVELLVVCGAEIERLIVTVRDYRHTVRAYCRIYRHGVASVKLVFAIHPIPPPLQAVILSERCKCECLNEDRPRVPNYHRDPE